MFGLHWGGICFLYGVLLLAIKSCINKGFYEASKIDKLLVHVTGALNLHLRKPMVKKSILITSIGDWDDDNNLSITEHGQRWKAILSEMLLMTALQYMHQLDAAYTLVCHRYYV